jgi:integrative and conjugative element protein (TIGR02256 family)
MYAHPLARGARILIEPEALAVVDGFRQHSDESLESGGILIGYRRGAHLHIVEATAPLRRDLQSRLAFHRSDDRHAAIAFARWSDSGQRADYLGDWHTHPESHANPSSIDIAEWRIILSKTRSPMLFWVAGTSSDWIGVGKGKQLKESHRCSTETEAREHI